MGITNFTVIAALIVPSIYPHIIDMPVPSNLLLHPQATTVTVENTRTDTASALQLAIDSYFANRNTTTTVARTAHQAKSRRVAAMHKISFS